MKSGFFLLFHLRWPARHLAEIRATTSLCLMKGEVDEVGGQS